MDRNETIKIIKAALQKRSGKAWSVTGGKGTAYGWIRIQSPPKRQTVKCRLKSDAVLDRPEDYEDYDSGQPGGYMTPEDRVELGRLLSLDGPVHRQGQLIGASNDYYNEYIARATGQAPAKIARPYWD